jgi:creatinine amidohydrolase
LLESLHGQGFRRFLLVNGHGGNDPGGAAATAWAGEHPGAQVVWHNWWNGPRTWAVVQSIDQDASHASWLENFPWTRLAGVGLPQERKQMADISTMRESDPADVRTLLGDGSLGGLYERPDDEILRVWQAGVEEVRELIESGWSRA